MVKSKRFAQVNKQCCVACGACIKECQKDAISIINGCYAQINDEICVGCGKCEAVCPAGSIELKARKKRDE
ncbi:electron transport complex protein RnfB [Acetitomaculum ruminis DSM 5522]|uniref:Electron transport complex protein RnfB n=1 Tax=Acetitomaculum ruminis DSM 5522 TaxID=1120918 RepID=A0A1I0ZTZ8_9FIRM|nr:4Fe-4S binding protein [Acetitomaculum ruminis]SFB29155.1 electron transport complex protein RnfB [Acetitomaculum ruminis DSM 5522]